MPRKDIILVLGAQWAYLHSSGNSYLGDDKAKTLKVRLGDFLSSQDKETSRTIFIKDVRSPEDPFWKNARTQCLVGSDDLNWVESLKPYISMPIQASRPSACHKTAVVAEIRKYDPTTVTLVGVETHSSILFTAADLMFNGFNVVVYEPLVASQDDHMHSSAISLMADTLGVDVRGS